MNRFTMCIGTVVLLVLLRVVIGWHFFKEGMSHYQDPQWSSEGFLRQAKGPLAPYFQKTLPNPYAWVQPIEPPVEGAAEGASTRNWEQWANDVAAKWKAHHDAFVEIYELDEERQKQAEALLKSYDSELRAYLREVGDDIDKHLYDVAQLGDRRSQAASTQLASQQAALADKEKELNAQSKEWNGEIADLQKDYHRALDNLLDSEQRLAPVEIQSQPGSAQSRLDLGLKIGLMVIGACLVVGLFTRLAAVLGGLFLLGVILMQPFWVPDTQPTYYQCVEALALFTLATTKVGRWAGLDFFVHHLITWPMRWAKGR